MVWAEEFLLRFDTVTGCFQVHYVKFCVCSFDLCAHEVIKVLLWAEILWPAESSPRRHTSFMKDIINFKFFVLNEINHSLQTKYFTIELSYQPFNRVLFLLHGKHKGLVCLLSDLQA